MLRSGYIHVILQFAGAGIVFWAAFEQPAPYSPAAIIVVILGIAIGLYTIMHNRIGNFNVAPPLKSNAKLITTGPYKLVRHPMYLSVIVVLIGLCIHAWSTPALVGALVSSQAMYGKSVIEEKLLLDRFPEYAAYRTTTKRLVPFVF